MDSLLHLLRFHPEDQLKSASMGFTSNINQVNTCIKFSQFFPKQNYVFSGFLTYGPLKIPAF